MKIAESMVNRGTDSSARPTGAFTGFGNSDVVLPSSLNNTGNKFSDDTNSNFSGVPKNYSAMKPPRGGIREPSPDVGYFGQAKDSLTTSLNARPKSSISQANDLDKGGFTDDKSASYNDIDSYVNMVHDHNTRMNRLVSFGKQPPPQFGKLRGKQQANQQQHLATTPYRNPQSQLGKSNHASDNNGDTSDFIDRKYKDRLRNLNRMIRDDNNLSSSVSNGMISGNEANTVRSKKQESLQHALQA